MSTERQRGETIESRNRSHFPCKCGLKMIAGRQVAGGRLGRTARSHSNVFLPGLQGMEKQPPFQRASCEIQLSVVPSGDLGRRVMPTTHNDLKRLIEFSIENDGELAIALFPMFSPKQIRGLYDISISQRIQLLQEWGVEDSATSHFVRQFHDPHDPAQAAKIRSRPPIPRTSDRLDDEGQIQQRGP